MLVLSTLCIKPIQNTSYQEIAQALNYTNNIQGYSKKNLHQLTTILQANASFNPEKDNAFIFANKPVLAYHQFELNRYWLEEILAHGSNMLDKIDRYELRGMLSTMPQKVLLGNKQAVQENSYMWGKPIHTWESVEFLERKITAHHLYLEKLADSK